MLYEQLTKIKQTHITSSSNEGEIEGSKPKVNNSENAIHLTQEQKSCKNETTSAKCVKCNEMSYLEACIALRDYIGYIMYVINSQCVKYRILKQQILTKIMCVRRVT